MVKDWEDLQELGLVEVLLESEEIGIPSPSSAEEVDLGDILRVNKDGYKLEYQEQTKTYDLKKINRSVFNSPPGAPPRLHF